jgi:hypothetical protein
LNNRDGGREAHFHPEPSNARLPAAHFFLRRNLPSEVAK